VSIVFGGYVNWTALSDNISRESSKGEDGPSSKWEATISLLKREPLWYSPVFFAMFPLIIAAGIGVGMLLIYHWFCVVTRNSTTYETIKKSYKKIGYKQDPRSITYKSPNCFIRIWMRLRCNYPQRQLLFKPQLLQSYFMERPRSTFKKLFQPEQEVSIQYND